MSDQFYAELATEVVDIINEFGAEFIIQTPGEYDDATMSSGPKGQRSVMGVISDQQTYNQLIGEQGATWTATKTLLLKPDAKPLPGESIIVEGKAYPLDKLVKIKPARLTLLYMLDVSK